MSTKKRGRSINSQAHNRSTQEKEKSTKAAKPGKRGVKTEEKSKKTRKLKQKPSNTGEREHRSKRKHHISCLKEKFSVLPPNWFYIDKGKAIEFVRKDSTSDDIKNHIAINEDFSVTVICPNNEKYNLSKKLSSSDDIFKYLKFVEKWPLCVGTQIEKERYSKQCRGIIVGEDVCPRNQVNPQCKDCGLLRCQLLKKNDSLISGTGKQPTKRGASSENDMVECKILKRAEYVKRSRLQKQQTMTDG